MMQSTVSNRTGHEPKWVIEMATDYATRHGLQTISMAAYYQSAEYKARATCNLRHVADVATSDIRATGGQTDNPISDNTPRHPGCRY